MRAVNVRFLLVSVGLVAVVGVGANLLHGIQLRRSAGILLEQGTQKINDGQPRSALGYLSRYISLAPHNADAQIQLADTLADMGQAGPAIAWYEKALLRDAGKHVARRRLVELSIAVRRFSAAKDHLLDFLLPYTPDDPRIYYLLGVAHEGLGEYPPAIQRFQEAIERDPTLVDAYSRLADILREQQKDSEQADDIIARLISQNPDTAKARIARADYRAKYRLPGVLDDVRDAVGLAPEDVEILIRAARTALDLAVETKEQEPLLSEAEGYLQKGLSLQPRFNGWYLGLAQADRCRGDLTQATAHIEAGLSAIPNDGDLQWNLADMMIQLDNTKAALGIVERLGDQGYPKVPLEYLVALADARRMRFVDAAERWRGVRGQMDSWPELARQTEYWLGVCYERLGEYGLQLTAFRNAVKIDPEWVPARQWLANALARTGRIDEAITEYEELAKLTGVPSSVYRELARLLVLRQLQRRNERREWQRVVRFLDQAGKVDSEADEYTILRAEVQAAQRQRKAARRTLEKGVEDYPDSIAMRLALAALEQSADRWDTADRLIAEARKKFGDRVDVRVARLRYLIQRHGVEAYDEVRALEREPLTGETEQKQRWRTSLAAAYYTLGKSADAGRLWQQAVEAEPDNILLRMFLFDLALADSDDARMQQLLAEIRRIERSDERPLWRYGEATRLVMQARKGDASSMTQAERLLEEVRAARPVWSRIPLLQAEIDEIRGDYDKVVEQYLAAIEMGERSPTIIRRVVELLYRQRRYVEADSVLRRFEATQLPITGELGRLAADVSFRVQDFSRAMQIAVQVIGNSESYEDLVWMGQLHSVMNQAGPAEEKFRAAIRKRPKSPEAWISLVQHFVRTDSPAKARLAITALTKSIDRAAAAFVEAVCLDALGDMPAARSKFNEAARSPNADAVVLRATANFYLSRGLPASGEPLLRRLLKYAGASKPDLTWTRRNLAVVWATTGNKAAKREALALIDENLREDPSAAEDRRAKAICLQALGGYKNSETALALMQELINTKQSAPSDYLLAYQLCSDLGRKADARRHLEQHTFENSSDPQNLVRYIRFVLSNNELHEARLWIERLQKLCAEGIREAPNTTSAERQRQRFHRYYVAAIGLEANLLLKQSDPRSAVATVQKHVRSGDNTADAALSAAEAAEILEGLARQTGSTEESSAEGLYSAAESLWNTSATTSPHNAALLVAFLARQDRLSEAVIAWKTYFHTSAADDFAIIGAALAAHPQIEAQSLIEITNRVKSLRIEHPSKAVLASLSQLLTFNGQHNEAIAIHREMLTRDPNDVVAMNNLACYLALSGRDKAEALSLIDKAIKMEGPVASLLDSRGMILLEMDRAQEALRDLEKAAEMAPSSVTYLHLAAARMQLKLEKGSAEAMAQAHKLGLDVHLLHPLERIRYSELLKHAAL
jgi:tetratricopeptide (TPR) repeat protein